MYGSVAAGAEGAESDVDVLIITDTLDHATAYRSLAAAERRLARTISPTLLTTKQWREKRAVKDSFIARIAEGPRLMVFGSDDDLA